MRMLSRSSASMPLRQPKGCRGSIMLLKTGDVLVAPLNNNFVSFHCRLAVFRAVLVPTATANAAFRILNAGILLRNNRIKQSVSVIFKLNTILSANYSNEFFVSDADRKFIWLSFLPYYLNFTKKWNFTNFMSGSTNNSKNPKCPCTTNSVK